MPGDNLLNERAKHELIAMMFKMAKSDARLTDQELQFVFDMAEKMGVPSGHVEGIYSNLSAYKLHPPKTERERMTILYQLLFMMKIDNNISEDENRFVHEVALKLGFRSEMIADMVKLMREHLTSSVPVDQMLDNIRKYLN